MDIKIISSHENAHKAEGLTVVIDVVRAFTTACYMLNNGAQYIIPVAEVDKARTLKKAHPKYVLAGERFGIPLKGFDYGNSPAEIAHTDFSGKIIVMTTSAGTQGIVKARNATEVITGAFVNAGAVAKYIQKKKPRIVTFIATDDRWNDTEDFLCATYIQSLIKETPIPFPLLRKKLEGLISTKNFLKFQKTRFGREDLDLCYALDTFNFVVRLTKRGLIS